VTNEGLYPTMTGGSIDGWWFDVRAAFDGAAIDLVHGERHEAVEGPSTLSLRWQQGACTMGVVDGAGQAIRGATFTILARTFAAGDAVTLPSTDDALYPDLSGALAGGFTATLSTNTAAGTGDATFEVLADGSLTPPFVDVNGGSFGLRCGVDPFPPVTTGTLVVRVTADGAPFAGAQVALTDAQGAAGTLTTDAAGEATRSDVAQGPATLTLSVPAGHHAVDPATGSQGVAIVAGGSTVATFTITRDETPPPTPVVNNPETWNYWKREVAAALKGRGHHEESFEDLAVKFPEEIFTGFAQHPLDPVRVEGITQVDPDGNGPKIARRLTLGDMDATLEAGGSDASQGARRELLVLLLNVVSGRLSLHLVVDAAGTPLEQEVRRLAAMINDGQPANDTIARKAAQRINAGRARWGSPAYQANGGTEPLVYGDANPDAVLDGPGADALALTATRAPGGAGVRLSFTLASPQRATLDVFDASGRRQARLYEGDAPAGTTAMTWTAAGGRPGVYFARLVTPAGLRTVKVIASR
ncbi:MAG: carboxypeptidase-like regulatory domain-containing protein, partial [Candidatus Eisenbacteria bacterium]